MSANVKKGQTWRSLRNGENCEVNAVKDFGYGVKAAQVRTPKGRLRWVTMGSKGITGYRLVGDLE